MRIALAALILFIPVASAQSMGKTYWSSVIAMAGLSIADANSSRGLVELNPALRSTAGSYSVNKGVGVKIGTGVAAVSLQLLFAKKHPKLVRYFVAENFAISGLYSYAAWHNTRLK